MEAHEIGQPLKLIKPGVKEKFLDAIEKGASYQIACGYAGFHYQTLRRWMLKGEALMHLHQEQIDVHDDKIYFDFYCDVRRVESYAALKWLERIDDASQVHWQAAAWKLERRHPEDYGRQERNGQSENEDSLVQKARSEVDKLKGDINGRSSSASG